MDGDTTPIELAVSQAKRVERESRVLIQMLARIRDTTNPQPQEAQDDPGRLRTHAEQ